MAAGMCPGIALGVTMGLIMDNLPVGIGVGLAIDTGTGASGIFDRKKKDHPEDSSRETRDEELK